MDDLEDAWYMNLLKGKPDKQEYQEYQDMSGHQADCWLDMGNPACPPFSDPVRDPWWMRIGEEERLVTGKDDNPSTVNRSESGTSTVYHGSKSGSPSQSDQPSVSRTTETKAAPYHVHKMSAVKCTKRHSDKSHLKFIKAATKIPFDNPQCVSKSQQWA